MHRPHFKDYVAGLFDDWMPLAGDRAFGDDQAILGGFATFRGRRVLVIGHEKGDDTASRLRHNFGMGKPEGYRKAIRLMQLADRFGLPVVTLVDTSGAFPGIQAEERGQAEAIARSTEQCLALGCADGCGSGRRGRLRRCDRACGGQRRADVRARRVFGHLARRVRVDSMAHGSDKAADAAEAMKVTAQDLKGLGDHRYDRRRSRWAVRSVIRRRRSLR